MPNDDDVKQTGIMNSAIPPNQVSVMPNDQTTSGHLGSILVTYDTRVDNKKGSKTSLVPLSFVFNQIRSSHDLEKKVGIIRSAPTDDERRDLKRKLLPYFTFLHFKDGIRQSESFQDVKFMLMDLDHIAEKLGILRCSCSFCPPVVMA